MSIKKRIPAAWVSKARQRVDALVHPLRAVWPRFPNAVIGLVSLTVIVVALLLQSASLAHVFSGIQMPNKYFALIEGFANPFRSRNVLLRSGLPIYDLSIGRQEYAAIEEAIEAARAQGYMDEDLQVWANATFIQGTQEYDVRVRVRGDLPNHWEGPKKSWRIRFVRQDIEYQGNRLREPIYPEGKRNINLIIPTDRDYALAPLVNSLMRDAGLVAPRDQFVILRINGRLQGLYYEVEHFDKPLFAAYRRPETTVFGQNDRAKHFSQYSRDGAAAATDAKYDLGTMSRMIEPGDSLAMRTMQVLIDHSVDPSPESLRHVRAVLDWDKYLRFRVLTTLLNTNHVRFGSDNLRLYFDPSRGRLEPIPWDAHLVRMPHEPATVDFWNSHGPDEIQRSTLLDPLLRLERNQYLWELVDDGGDRLMDRFDDLHDRLRPLAWADVLSTPVHGFRMDELRKDFAYNVRRTHYLLSQSTANLTYRLRRHDLAELELTTNSFSGVHFDELRLEDPLLDGEYYLYEDSSGDGQLDRTDAYVMRARAGNGVVRFFIDELVLPSVKYDGDEIAGRYWEYFDTRVGRRRFFITGTLAAERRDPIFWTPPVIEAHAVNAVTGQEMASGWITDDALLPEHSVGITAYDASTTFDLDAPLRTRREFLRQHPAFRASTVQQGGVELGGEVRLEGVTLVPERVPLSLRPGTTLTLAPGASLVAYGGLTAEGQPDARIRIQDDGTGAWGTLAAVRPDEPVVLRYVDMSGGGQTHVNGILFTGGFAVHDGDLTVEHSTFSDMTGEDGLNLKNGQVRLANTTFVRSASDAVDLDFVTGEVWDSQFLDSVNDGLDMSGSAVVVVNGRFQNNGDKGISVGEDSHPIVLNSLFVGNNIGLSSKDLSHARVAFATFTGNRLALEGARKKEMFGGGSAELVNSVFRRNEVLLQEDYFSAAQMVIRRSVTDETVACVDCEVAANIAFEAPDTGDFRLSAGATGAALEPDVPSWLEPYLTTPPPPVPGVYAPAANN